jgi:hypothetical protein
LKDRRDVAPVGLEKPEMGGNPSASSNLAPSAIYSSAICTFSTRTVA